MSLPTSPVERPALAESASGSEGAAAVARPAVFCRLFLGAIDASEGRRRRRLRDTEPDSIGLAMERDLAERAVRDDPAPAEFEAWLLACCQEHRGAPGPLLAIARRLLDQWRLAQTSPAFASWLASGAPSDDAGA